MSLLTADEVQQLAYQVWGASFAISLLAGVLIHRGHFCTMGAISDWVAMRDATRLRQWALAVAVAMAGFGLMAWLGWISPLSTIYAASQLTWRSAQSLIGMQLQEKSSFCLITWKQLLQEQRFREMDLPGLL